MEQHLWKDGAECSQCIEVYTWAARKRCGEASYGEEAGRKELTVFPFGLPFRTSLHQLVNVFS